MTQCYQIVNQTISKKFQFNMNQHTWSCIHIMHMKMSSAKWQPFYTNLDMLSSECNAIEIQANCPLHRCNDGPSVEWHFRPLRPGSPISKMVYEFMTKISRNLLRCDLDSSDPIRWHFLTCHDSSAVVACAKVGPHLFIVLSCMTDVDFDNLGATSS